MKKSIKAALYSGLVFPGAGQFSLQRYLRGMIFFIPSMISILFVVNHILSQAMSIVDQIERGEMPMDPAVISNLISAGSGGNEFMMLNTAQWIFIVLWILSIIDAYQLGEISDQADKT